jgi:hypothetical protein
MNEIVLSVEAETPYSTRTRRNRLHKFALSGYGIFPYKIVLRPKMLCTTAITAYISLTAACTIVQIGIVIDFIKLRILCSLPAHILYELGGLFAEFN